MPTFFDGKEFNQAPAPLFPLFWRAFFKLVVFITLSNSTLRSLLFFCVTILSHSCGIVFSNGRSVYFSQKASIPILKEVMATLSTGLFRIMEARHQLLRLEMNLVAD